MSLKDALTKYGDSLIVFSSSLLVYLLFLLGWMRSIRIPDEMLYHNVGIAYVRGIASGDLDVFMLNPEHPPLAKIVTGILAVALHTLGLGEYPIPTRVHFSLAVALMSVIVFKIGEQLRGRRSRWLFWLFFLPIPAITSINYYSVVDATSLLFFLCSFKSLLLDRRYLRSGIFYGLASLSKFVPLPLFPAIIASWSLYKKAGREEVVARLRVVGIGLLVFCLGEPLIWTPKLFSVLIEALSLRQHSSAIWSTPFLHFVQGQEEAIFEIVAFLFYTISYPCERFLNINLYVLFLLSLYAAVVRKWKLSDPEVFLLLVVSATHLIFAVNRVRMWYHDFWVALPMTLFLASIVSGLVEKRAQRKIEKDGVPHV